MICSSVIARLRPTQALYIKHNDCVGYEEENDRSPWTHGKWVECHLNSSLVTLKPAFRSVVIKILAPGIDVAMDRIVGYAENGTFDKILAHNLQSAFWNYPRKAERKGRTETERLVDAGIKISQTFDLISCCDQLVFRSQFLIELLLKFFLSALVTGEIVADSAKRTKDA